MLGKRGHVACETACMKAPRPTRRGLSLAANMTGGTHDAMLNDGAPPAVRNDSRREDSLAGPVVSSAAPGVRVDALRWPADVEGFVGPDREEVNLSQGSVGPTTRMRARRMMMENSVRKLMADVEGYDEPNADGDGLNLSPFSSSNVRAGQGIRSQAGACGVVSAGNGSHGLRAMWMLRGSLWGARLGGAGEAYWSR